MHTPSFRSVLRSTLIALSLTLAMAGAAFAQAADEPLRSEVLAQIAAIQRMKASETPAERKISSRLLYAIKRQRGELPPGLSLRIPSLADASGRIEVDIAASSGADLRGALASRNAAVMSVKAEPGGGVYARARLDANGILALAARPTSRPCACPRRPRDRTRRAPRPRSTARGERAPRSPKAC